MKRTRKQYPSALKAKIVLEALGETKTVVQLAAEHQIHPNLIAKWKQTAVADLSTLFERGTVRDEKAQVQEAKLAELYQEIGKLTTQVNGLKKNLVSNRTPEQRRALVERDTSAELPLNWQAALLCIWRARLYYRARPIREQEVALKHRLDVLYTAYPFLGSRKIVRILAGEGYSVGRHTIRRYRQEMGMATLFPRPKLSVPGSGPEHRVFPYLLRGLSIARPNQLWVHKCVNVGVDITYIRLVNGWMYLVAFLDWHSRYVVAWELSDTLEMDFVLACRSTALEVALPRWLCLRSSTATREVTSPASGSQGRCCRRACRSRWMVGAGAWTTSSRNACGAVSSTRRST